jgi:hypothetical protein
VIDRTPVDWRVPTAEWHAFIDYVREEFGGVEGYLGRETEMAMREYCDEDRYSEVEETVDRLVEAAGRRPSDHHAGEKISQLDTAEKTRVQVRVDDHIKDEFREVASQADDPYGVELARALSEYRDGGRAGRLERKLDRVAEDAEDLLGELDKSERDSGPGAVQRRTITICNRLGDQFTGDELVEEISSVVSSAPRASEQTLEKYRELVTGRLDVEPHPVVEKNPAADADRLWVPAEVAEQNAPDGLPRAVRVPVWQVDHEGLVRRVQLEAGRRAAEKPSGSVSLPLSELRQEVFDGELSASDVREILTAATLREGYQFDESGDSAELKVDITTAGSADGEFMSGTIAYRESDAPPLLPSAAQTTFQPWTPDEDAGSLSGDSSAGTAPEPVVSKRGETA